MPKFRVTVDQIVRHVIVVNAENDLEACDMAEHAVDYNDFDYVTNEGISDESVEIHDVYEVEED